MVDNDYYGWLIIKMENPVRSLSEWMIRMVNHEIRLEWMIYRGTCHFWQHPNAEYAKIVVDHFCVFFSVDTWQNAQENIEQMHVAEISC